MINWIIGGGIIALTIYIIVKRIIRMRKGEMGCCGGCTASKGGCDCKHG
ncbi:hypothetical protein [Cellulosilyticum sp. I15G10I2]|nr:hypothetical protein [Cellulosilyticum sp. I15G10I2]